MKTREQPKVPRFVELIRVSTQGQAQKDTPERQRHELDRWRGAQPGTIVERIEAPGVSGTLPLTESREGRRLIELAGKFDELRVVHVSRVFGARSGDPADQVAVASLCYKAGAVIATTDGRRYDPRNPVDMMMLNFECSMASKDRSELIEKTNQGRMRAARRNGQPGARRYYGRRFNPALAQWEFDEVERAALEKIIAWIFDGVSVNEIARRLNGIGAPTALGQKSGSTTGLWYATSVLSILRHRHLYGESYYTNKHLPGERAELRPPPLMTKSEWERLQNVLDSRRSAGRPANPERTSVCVGRIFCPCGARLYKRNRYYICSSAASTARNFGKSSCQFLKLIESRLLMKRHGSRFSPSLLATT